LFTGNQGQSAKVKAGANSAVRVHSIAALPQGRNFVGTFEAAGKSYEFAFAPARASIVERKKLLLTGTVTITGQGIHTSSHPDVRAFLASTQGGVGTAPPPYNAIGHTGGAAPPTTKDAGHPTPPEGAEAPRNLPATDNTGPTSFSGVMYFRLEGLGASAGVPADLSHVQLNARLYATDDVARHFHSLYSALVGELSREPASQEALDGLVQDLNHLLKEAAEHPASG
jgi:hypothetical protein